MAKDKLVVLDAGPCCYDAEQIDALLLNRGNRYTPFIVAHGFDAESFSWRQGSYHSDLMDAVCDFKGLPNPKWSVPACSPHDVIEQYGGEYLITDGDAERVAKSVNDTLELYDDFYASELWQEVSDGFIRRDRATQEELLKFERRAEADQVLPVASQSALVAGTMYLDCNGYDHIDTREVGKPGASASPDGPADTFVTLGLSTQLVEEEMAKEGIPLTQPNVAFMSDKIAKAIYDDAQENAACIASDTVAYWGASVPDAAQTTMEKEGEIAKEVARRINAQTGGAGNEDEDQANASTRKIGR